MTYIIMDPTPEQSVAEQMAFKARIMECRALFAEALRRGKVQREANPQKKRTDHQIILIAMQTLAMNGFNRREIEAALTGAA